MQRLAEGRRNDEARTQQWHDKGKFRYKDPREENGARSYSRKVYVPPMRLNNSKEQPFKYFESTGKAKGNDKAVFNSLKKNMYASSEKSKGTFIQLKKTN